MSESQKDKRKKQEIQMIRRRAIPVLRRYHIRRASLFGSFARGEQRKKSDVDLLVDVPKRMGLFEFIGLKQDLEQRLGRPVDLVTYAYIHPFLKERILNEQVVIYAKGS